MGIIKLRNVLGRRRTSGKRLYDLPKKMSGLNSEGWVGVNQVKEEWKDTAPDRRNSLCQSLVVHGASVT